MISAYTIHLNIYGDENLTQKDIEDRLGELFPEKYIVKKKITKDKPSWKSAASKPLFRKVLLERDGQDCCWCKLPLDLEVPPWNNNAPTIEHIKRRSEGGAVNDLDNLALAHKKCNNERHK